MRARAVLAILPILALGGGCEPNSSGSPKAELQTPCPPFDKLDRSRLTTHWEDWDGEDVSVVWATWRDGLEASSEPFDVSLDISVTPYPASDGYKRFDIHGLRSGGRWRMERRSFPPATENPFTAELSPWEAFDLSEPDGRALDAVLSGECLWKSPRFLAAQVPLKNGRTQLYFHEPLTLFEIRRPNREWGGAHEVMASDPGRITNLLVAAAFYPGQSNGRTIHDFGSEYGVSRPAAP